MKLNIKCFILLAVLITITSVIIGCASPKGSTGMEKRANVQQMCNDALLQMYNHKPAARSEINAAPGYAVFEAVQAQFLITSTGNAYGIVHDNQTGEDIYMSAFSAGAGFGAGLKNFRAVVIFKDSSIMDEFVNKGWVFGATGTADATTDAEGATVSGAASFDDRLTVYTFTDKGLMAGASLRGVKVWKDEKLN
jgi:lipid-binding SYLF domain-containing protein